MSDQLFTLSRVRAFELLRKDFPGAQVVLQDNSYNVVTEESVVSFASELREDLRANGYHYSRRWDCDDFALQALALARRKHAEAARQGFVGLAEGPLVGLLHFDCSGGAHAALAIYLCGLPSWGPAIESWEWYVFEPQTGKLRMMTDAERRSTTFFLA